ncbi:MAG: Predicted ATPase [Candidatus Kentron sp. G]|nr:MAG: Predicted ATPase [Candidatus Kentron sp. G]VFN03907.1 MAG: Predicted ATPase [Candidatus Kentron sp. G]VFN05182.1 MAG: Predicted ATPase [Candidatus Kentron sp. G]
MKIRVENLGALRQAEFSLGDLTIICGENNTGKTYATCALYGFLRYWREHLPVRVSDETIRTLLSDGAVHIDVAEYQKDVVSLLEKGSANYTEQLPAIFAASKDRFKESEFLVEVDPGDIDVSRKYERIIAGAGNTDIFSLGKARDGTELIVTLLVEKEALKPPRDTILWVIGNVLRDILFEPLFPDPFIASAERTGAAIFRKELDFARNRLIEEIGQGEKNIDPMKLFYKTYKDYALPVKENVDFTRQLEETARESSFIAEDHEEILSDFSDIIGGKYTVTRNDELYFLPKGRRGVKLSMDESSSAVRSLLDIGFYLKHIAKPGDILMVDEPELNLHPRNQRRVARLFARLVNIGIKVFVTTHSDYLIKELNTLIMLHPGGPRLEGIAEREGYLPQELLSPEQINVYIAEEKLLPQPGKTKRKRGLTLTPANIDPDLGIEVRSFDTTIVEMNQIQDEILWGEE